MASPPVRGRPPVSPGEASVELRVMVGGSLRRQLRHIAIAERSTIATVVRTALRNFIAVKLTASAIAPIVIESLHG